MTDLMTIGVTPVLVAELLAEGERMPVYVHVIDHPDARVLVDTGMTRLHPAVADMDPRSEDDYTIREWVDAPGVQYVPVDGELELLPGLRVVPTPGHTPGSQVVAVATGGRPVVIGGDTAVFFDELDEPRTEGQRLVPALDPEAVWLSHQHEPWRPPADRHV
jgi:N-acyl homoserine lactone hydrolase